MGQLVNLALYKQELERKIQDKNFTDCLLPESLKKMLTSFRGYNFEYYNYTMKISTLQGDCYIPNQWMYIGALCSQYHSELMKYKSKLIDLGITEDQFRRCHPGRDDKEISDAERQPEYLQSLAEEYLASYHDDDKELLVSFLYDYDSWGGGKNISRTDFTASPVLAIAHSINASSGLIGIIAEALAERTDIRQLLLDSEEWNDKGKKTIARIELLRNNKAASFLRLALSKTIETDLNLSVLMQREEKIKITSKRLRINDFSLGCDLIQLPRENDYDKSIRWEYQGREYCFYKEWTPEDMERKFFPEYNDAYKSIYEMRKEGDNYVLYQIVFLSSSPLQTIFYGTPGSGKSHGVNKLVKKVYPNEKEREEFVFRTTFHPDSDYASFVGCYKPVMKNNTKRNSNGLTIEELAQKLSDYYNVPRGGQIDGLRRFCYEFSDCIKKVDLKKLVELAEVSANFDGEIKKYLSYGDLFAQLENTTISYEFTPQAFTKAYVKAWQNPREPVYLIIEEINRGNCAQIFGDLFQLLDRKDGVSEYPIDADNDLKDYLEKKLGIGHEGIANGKLKLPSNLNILATMNTSDQSLFPMDSAFKRRWSWQCVPIEYEEKKRDGSENKSYYFTINIDNDLYSWHDFLKKVNVKIKKTTLSEDKQMGNFFITNSIDERQFIDKVMFYLWNDICKDEYGANSFFRRYIDENNPESEFSFNDLFEENYKDILTGFMKYLSVEIIKTENNSEQ